MEQFHLLFFNRDKEEIFNVSTEMMEEDSELDFQQFLKICTPNESCDPEIVFSMKIGKFFIDIATCMNLFCASVIPTGNKTECAQLNPMLAISAMLPVASDAINENTITDLKIPDNPLFQIKQEFSSLLNEEVEYIAIVTTLHQVLSTFGQLSLTKNEYAKAWDLANTIIEVIDDEEYCISEDSNCIVAFSFIPGLYLLVFYSIAVDDDDELLNEFVEKLRVLKAKLSYIFI